MKLKLDEEMRQHLKAIDLEAKNEREWAEIEADDWFQSESYCGGFDAEEMAFTFSFYDRSGKEFWFQFPLQVVQKALNSKEFFFDLRSAGH